MRESLGQEREQQGKQTSTTARWLQEGGEEKINHMIEREINRFSIQL